MYPKVIFRPGDFIILDKDVYEFIEKEKDLWHLKDKINMESITLHIDELSNKLSSCEKVEIWRYKNG